MTEFALAVTLGALFALGTFLVLRRDIVRVIWGVTIISQAANVYLVTVGFGPTGGGAAPIVAGHGAEASPVDPLVQALVLTAIVIGFGTTAFALVLTYRVYEEHGTIDLSDLARGGGQSTGTGAGGTATTDATETAPPSHDGQHPPAGDDRQSPIGDTGEVTDD